MRSDLVATKQVSDNGTSALEQIAFSDMLASGAFGRHVRRQRSRYRQRRDYLVTVVQRRAPRIRARSLSAGLFVLLELPPGAADEETIIADAANHDMHLVPIRGCWSLRPAPDLLAVGFAAPPDRSFREAVERLADLLAHHTDGCST